jgi:integrase
LTFAAFADLWEATEGAKLVRPRDNTYRLRLISAFELPGGSGGTFGAKLAAEITSEDIEAYRDARVAAGLAPATVNHDLKLLRKMFNWGVRKRLLDSSPFKIGTESAVALLKETPRAVRFTSDDDERRLLDAAGPHLRDVLIALLDTACRPGEILSLQWGNVSLERGEFVIVAGKEKTRTGRVVPLTTRLREVLQRRRVRPDGHPHGPDAYVFGNEVGERRRSVREAFERARAKAGMPWLQLRDLRREASSRYTEAGVPVHYVSKLLGHTNLSTTSRYLAIQTPGLHQAVRLLEARRSAPTFAQPLHTEETYGTSADEAKPGVVAPNPAYSIG